MLRDNKLNLLTSMRSNDIYWGLSHDVFCFTMLQEAVARALGAELGTYKHVVGSLHLYLKDKGPSKRFLKEGYQSTSPVMPPMPEGDPWTNIRNLLALEATIRTSGMLDSAKAEKLPPYWRDLVRMLQVFKLKQLKQKREIEEIERIRDEFSCELYRPFVDRVIRNLAAMRSDGNRGNENAHSSRDID